MHKLSCPARRGKKKTVAGQAASCAYNGFSGYCGGFEYIKAAVPYALDKGVTPTR